ncbi:hypothetical protein ASC97_02620 [Rhizobium sp. Root1203]|nr:hypothetical protein ASC97_02620 [Rhizobium sp. Root1203]
MKAIADLLDRLVLTPSRNGKLKLLADYFGDSPDPDRDHGDLTETIALVWNNREDIERAPCSPFSPSGSPIGRKRGVRRGGVEQRPHPQRRRPAPTPPHPTLRAIFSPSGRGEGGSE